MPYADQVFEMADGHLESDTDVALDTAVYSTEATLPISRERLVLREPVAG